jgi:hypothetical protein
VLKNSELLSAAHAVNPATPAVASSFNGSLKPIPRTHTHGICVSSFCTNANFLPSGETDNGILYPKGSFVGDSMVN